MSNSNKLYEWVPKSRGDVLPLNAVYAGTTPQDGHVYIGRFRNAPGKVNLNNGNIYNFWVQSQGSQRDGELLITDNTYKWVHIQRGDKIPQNAIYSGKDGSNDKVWVGRALNGEPGKINCINNNSSTPTMNNLWCHSNWSSDQKANILIIEENEKIIEEHYETNEEKEEEIKLMNDKINFLNQKKNNEIPLWTHNKVGKISKVLKTSDLHISAGNIANGLFKIIKSAFGDIISIVDLCDKIELHLTSSISEELITSKEIIVSEPDEKGFKKCIILLFSKQDITKTRKIIGLFNSEKSYIDFKIDYTLLGPNNELAQDICDQLIHEKTMMLIESFRPRKKIQ